MIPEDLRNTLTETLNTITSEESYTDYKEMRGVNDFLLNHLKIYLLHCFDFPEILFNPQLPDGDYNGDGDHLF